MSMPVNMTVQSNSENRNKEDCNTNERYALASRETCYLQPNLHVPIIIGEIAGGQDVIGASLMFPM